MPTCMVGRGYFPLHLQGALNLCFHIKADEVWKLLFWCIVSPLYEVEKAALLP